MAETTLKIEKTYPFKTSKQPKAVFLIGAGGTGSYVVPALARDIHTLAVKPQIVLCDGDIVEEKNLKRQHFITSDIGQNKAAALAQRYSAAFGLAIGYRDEFIEQVAGFSELLASAKGPSIVITCVDNIKTRLHLREAIAKAEHEVYWIDCGNEAVAGQVVLGARIPWWKTTMIFDGVYPMPDVFDLYPELIERAKVDKLPTEMSCAELAAAAPQYGFVNLTAATMALNYAHDLLHREPIRTNVVEFSIKNKFAHKSLVESNIEAWCTFFDKFKTFDVFKKARAAALNNVVPTIDPKATKTAEEIAAELKR